MYEGMTYETILGRMLDKIPDELDKRESSIIYNALAPAAAELTLLYIEFDIIFNETFGDTASRDYLIRRARERGVVPYSATYAIAKGEFSPASVAIPIGSRFSLDDLNFEVTKLIRPGEYELTCEQSGSTGNNVSGTLIPIEYIDGLETAMITSLLVPGDDEESTENIRNRYFETFETSPFAGNEKDYIQRTNAISGVGGTKVTPAWDGGGTVKLTIIDSELAPASVTLIDAVQEAVDPTKDGEGKGIAPIGHVVTVDTASEVAINILAKMTFYEGYSFAGQKEAIERAIQSYIDELRANWANEPYLIIRISQIESRLLELEGVLDISDTRLNGVAENVSLGGNEIPKLGSVVND